MYSSKNSRNLTKKEIKSMIFEMAKRYNVEKNNVNDPKEINVHPPLNPSQNPFNFNK